MPDKVTIYYWNHSLLRSQPFGHASMAAVLEKPTAAELPQLLVDSFHLMTGKRLALPPGHIVRSEYISFYPGKGGVPTPLQAFLPGLMGKPPAYKETYQVDLSKRGMGRPCTKSVELTAINAVTVASFCAAVRLSNWKYDLIDTNCSEVVYYGLLFGYYTTEHSENQKIRKDIRDIEYFLNRSKKIEAKRDKNPDRADDQRKDLVGDFQRKTKIFQIPASVISYAQSLQKREQSQRRFWFW